LSLQVAGRDDLQSEETMNMVSELAQVISLRKRTRYPRSRPGTVVLRLLIANGFARPASVTVDL
jgi:hypothetical protein